jgi:hypothetical protein
MSEDRPELDPDIAQKEDGIVVEPGSEIDRDLQAKLSGQDATGQEADADGQGQEGRP